jgi:hypothetical protein
VQYRNILLWHGRSDESPLAGTTKDPLFITLRT